MWNTFGGIKCTKVEFGTSKFDSRNNWIERDEITGSGEQVIRQNRTIRYL